MTFEDVFPYAKDGYPIRRKAWGKAYIKMFEYDSGEREFITMFGNPVKLNYALFIDDWEIVEMTVKSQDDLHKPETHSTEVLLSTIEELERVKKLYARAKWWLNEIVSNHRFTPISTAEMALKDLKAKELEK